MRTRGVNRLLVLKLADEVVATLHQPPSTSMRYKDILNEFAALRVVPFHKAALQGSPLLTNYIGSLALTALSFVL